MLQFVCMEKNNLFYLLQYIVITFVLWTSGIGTLLYVEMCVQVDPTFKQSIGYHQETQETPYCLCQ